MDLMPSSFNINGNGFFPEKLKATLLVLIPKVEEKMDFTQFWPISPCNVAYKMITKVSANRMRRVIHFLIGEGQSSFVPNRNITNNIILAQDVAHSMRKKDGKKIYRPTKSLRQAPIGIH